MPTSLSHIFLMAAGALTMDAFVFGTLGLDNYAGIWGGNEPHVH